jgi:DNA-binding HxlR family transcriptional regulator
LAPVIPLFHRSYAVPAIACLYAEQGAKFVTLVHRLGASRDTVSLTLKYLVGRGIVMKNPGYGHPMRPEYVLTAAGQRLGESCVRVVAAVDELDIAPVAFKKWPMPVVAAVGGGADRFSSLLGSLEGVTPRALTGALRDLSRIDVVERSVTASWPPHPRYVLARAGERLMPALDGLREAVGATRA